MDLLFAAHRLAEVVHVDILYPTYGMYSATATAVVDEVNSNLVEEWPESTLSQAYLGWVLSRCHHHSRVGPYDPPVMLAGEQILANSSRSWE